MDFPGSTGVRTLQFQCKAGQVPSLVGKLKILHATWHGRKTNKNRNPIISKSRPILHKYCIQFFFWGCVSVALSPSPSYLCPLSITVSRCRWSPLSLSVLIAVSRSSLKTWGGRGRWKEQAYMRRKQVTVPKGRDSEPNLSGHRTAIRS